MPIARGSLRCGSPNAFHPQKALWNLFLDHHRVHGTRQFSLTLPTPQEAQTLQDTPAANGEDGRAQATSIIPSDYVETGSLENTLQAIRAENRKGYLDPDHNTLPIRIIVPKDTSSRHQILEIAQSRHQKLELARSHYLKQKREEAGPSQMSPATIRRIPAMVNDKLELAQNAHLKSKSKDVDLLFEDRRFSINKFSFPRYQDSSRGSGITQKQHRHEAPPTTDKSGLIEQKKSLRTPADLLEYEGMYVRPSVGSIEPSQELPWVADIPVTRAGWDRLDQEISNFLQYIKPTEAEKAARHAVSQKTRDIISDILPDISTEVFGSQRTGLTLATSDIDIRVYDADSMDEDTEMEKAPRQRTRKEMTYRLKKICEHFDRHKDYMLCLLRHARYPLVTMVHKESGIDFQIVASNDSSRSRDIIKEKLDTFPHLFELFAVVKAMLDIRGLSDVFRGGLGSYTLFMMVVAALQFQQFPKWTVTKPLGAQLKFVLDYYGKLDTYKHALALSAPIRYPKHSIDKKAIATKYINDPEKYAHVPGLHQISIIDEMQPYLLCLQDPADSLNDLGRKGYGFKHIQATMKALGEELTKNLQPGKMRVGENPSILAPLVGNCYQAYKQRREITEAYGRQIIGI